jgi:hypothetical protein
MRRAFRAALFTLAELAPAMLAQTATANDDMSGYTRAVVIGMHSAESTRNFAGARGIPQGQAAGGRYALVRLVDDLHHRGAYALVYVPPNLKVARDDRVEIAAHGFDVVTEPGRGVVLGIAGQEREQHH